MRLVKNHLNSRLKQNLSRLGNWLISCDHHDVYRSDFPPDSPLVSPPSARLRYSVHEDEGVLALMEAVCPQSRENRKFVRRRLDKGDKAVIGFRDDQPVFYGWLMFREIEASYGVFMPLGAHMAFAYNLFTRSSHRREGAMSGFYDFARLFLWEQEFHTLYVGISRDNEPSIRAHRKNGFSKAGYFHTLKLLGLCFTLSGLAGVKRFSMNSPQ